ncbi:PTS sugar transporter subunit IIA [Mycoplasma parvum]|uniref:PTS EIIA type-1 domain-containing protein n=1 Tax=Mycoplasma parvum str. Indiana TaxID=1403316 RepID=U5NBK8_9MOLU|nr:PTS glucose transporter subunit IIA [Mycoplasma parvum]AGX88802.1 hypothetical protein PRV_00055 [Mycoplasma parvum str. Indiana]
MLCSLLSTIIQKVKSFLKPCGCSEKVFKVVNIYSPMDGTIVSQRRIPDEGFSEGYMGEGLGLKPKDNGEILSPLGGKLEVVFRTQHAYIIRESIHNIAVMLHLGINTVNIPAEEKAFETIWAQGQDIKEKEVLCQMNLETIRRIMKEEEKKRSSGEISEEEKPTSDISALLVQTENMENKKVEILKKDGDDVEKGELIMRIISSQ